MSQVTLADGATGPIFGTQDEHLRAIEKTFGVTLNARGQDVQIVGDAQPTSTVEHLLTGLSTLVEKGYRLRTGDVRTAIHVMEEDPSVSLVDFFQPEGVLATVHRLIRPRSLRQQLYVRAMLENDIVMSIGPAGTGKTYLAVAVAAAALQEKRVRRIVLARPAVEAGEKLGFLPGDMVEKVNPYLRPLYDALYDIMGYEKVTKLIEHQVIEIAPIAFMRGRTLNDSFVILDEAQNTTSEQMKMCLTRIGFGSKAVINGDVTQVDLPPGKVSGLREAQQVLAGVEGICFLHFNQRDVVRHPLVQKVIHAYDRFEEQRQGQRDGRERERP